MSVTRTALSLARRVPFQTVHAASRTFTTAAARRASKYDLQPGEKPGKMVPFNEVKSMADLLPPGAERGTIPTDLEQATGLERMEILGKMEGIDIFDMSPLPADRVGTFEDPICVKSAGLEHQLGCTGCPADSHVVKWLVTSRKRPFERCPECGSVYRMDYIGPSEDPHAHHGDHGHGEHHEPPYEEPKTMADYVRKDYWYR